MKAADTFFEQLRADPDNLELRLVVADALGESGDPLGELISVQSSGGAPAREAELRATLEAEIFARVARPWPTLEWTNGFVSALDIDRAPLDLSHRALALVKTARASVSVARLIDCLSAGELPCVCEISLDLSERDLEPDLWPRLFASVPALAGLRVLSLRGPDSRALADALDGHRFLRSLELAMTNLPSPACHRFIGLELPALERFALATRPPRARELRPELTPLLVGDAHPQITELGLFGFEPAEEVLDLIAASSLAQRLTGLGIDFDGSGIAGLNEALRRHRGIFGAIEFFDRADARQVASRHAVELYRRGRALSMILRRHDEARDLLEAARRLNPDDAWIPFEIGNLIYRQGRHRESFEIYEQLTDTVVRDQAERMQARALVRLDEPERALLVAERLEARVPDDLSNINLLGWIQDRAYKLEPARATYERTLARSMVNQPALWGLAGVLAKLNRCAEAAEIYERLATLASESDPPRRLAALTRLVGGDAAGAEEAMRAMIAELGERPLLAATLAQLLIFRPDVGADAILALTGPAIAAEVGYDRENDRVGNVHGAALVMAGRLAEAATFYADRGTSENDGDAAIGAAMAAAALGEAARVDQIFNAITAQVTCTVESVQWRLIRALARPELRSSLLAPLVNGPHDPEALLTTYAADDDRRCHPLDLAIFPGTVCHRATCAVLAICACILVGRSAEAQARLAHLRRGQPVDAYDLATRPLIGLTAGSLAGALCDRRYG